MSDATHTLDRARRRLAVKCGGRVPSLDADESDIPAPAPDDQLLAVDEGLARYATVDPRKAELVKLRYFVGLSFEEAAEVLGIAVPTAKQYEMRKPHPQTLNEPPTHELQHDGATPHPCPLLVRGGEGSFD